MISPELLRRYRFFYCMDDGQQKAVAMISDIEQFPAGAFVFNEGDPAEHLYLLIDGSVTLSVAIAGVSDHLGVGDVSPGEPFGLCALLHNQAQTSSAQATSPSRAIRISAQELRELSALDCKLGFCLMQQVATAAIDQLRMSYIQLAVSQV